ncbi:MAG: serine hydrolase [Kangiellaceae bacterium]|nr:serine hydrolase [Kangiellaceae bacterium]
MNPKNIFKKVPSSCLKLSRVITSTTGVLVVAFSLNSFAEGKNPIEREIITVENGLRGSVQFAGDENWNIKERMEFYGVPGVSIAVIKDYKIHWVKSYGVTDRETNQAVDQNTLFQAGSISKPVAAYGALKLVEQNKLSLDKPANQFLKDWKIPDNEFTKEQPVALKHILNHSAGLTVHGFWGYSEGLAVPTVTQVLNGEKPANSSAVVVDMLPQTKMRYSGGGYTVMQKMVSDVSGSDYPTVMNNLVLKPLAMSKSTYEQPLPAEKLKHAAAGYLPNKKPVPGKRHVYPEMAAAGLWTTASDLAKFAIDIQTAIKSDKSKVLSQSMTEKMLTPWVSKNTGLGLFIDTKSDSDIYFGHGGWDEGFSADMVAHKTGGYGVVIMTNSNHPAFIEELKNSVASYYQWANYIASQYQSIAIDEIELNRISGRYYFDPDMLFTISKIGDKVMMKYLDGTDMEVFRIEDNVYVRREHDRKFSFIENSKTRKIELVFDMGNGETVTRRRLEEGEKMLFEYVIQGDLDKAEDTYADFFANTPNMKEQVEWNISNFADKLSEQGKNKQALKLRLLSSRLFEASAMSWMKLAKFYESLNKTKSALESYKKVLIMESENKKVLEAIARLTNKVSS